MKKSRIEKEIIEELSKTRNVSRACERVGISRNSFYRWIKEDQSFRKKIEHAVNLGTESLRDLAESKLILNVKNGNQRAIEYTLNNYDRILLPQTTLQKTTPLENTKGTVFIVKNFKEEKYETLKNKYRHQRK